MSVLTQHMNPLQHIAFDTYAHVVGKLSHHFQVIDVQQYFLSLCFGDDKTSHGSHSL